MGSACCTEPQATRHADGGGGAEAARSGADAPSAAYVAIAQMPSEMLRYNMHVQAMRKRNRPPGELLALDEKVWREDAFSALTAAMRQQQHTDAPGLVNPEYILAVLDRSLSSRQRRVAVWQRTT
jgi:hypothetical protein